MIDALYPIMGGMISKYVTQSIKELMEQINRKIEDGLSVERFKRKIKAKLSGVSETELLLEESGDALISALFVIHKETGLLISSASLKNYEIDDPQMVASMASAIKDFINDWINHHQKEKESIQILSYGNATLYIESAGSVYVIAFLESEPDHELRSDINSFFALIVKHYASFFQNFDGDDSDPEVAELSHKMQDYLLSQTNLESLDVAVKKRNPAKFIFMALGILLLGYGGYISNEWYKTHTLEKQIKQKIAQEVTLHDNGNAIELSGYTDTLTPISDIIALIEKETGKPVINHLILSSKGEQLLLNEQQQYLESYEQKLVLLQKQFLHNMKPLQDSVSKLQKKIFLLEEKEKEMRHILHLKDEIASNLFSIMKTDSFYNGDNQTLDFAKLHLFGVQKVDYDSKAISSVKGTFEKYFSILRLYKPYLKKIIIEGHSDSSGDAVKNIAITKKRADAIKTYLLGLPFIQEANMGSLLETEGKGSTEPILVDGKEDQNASRRITIRFELDKEIWYKSMQKMYDIQHYEVLKE